MRHAAFVVIVTIGTLIVGAGLLTRMLSSAYLMAAASPEIQNINILSNYGVYVGLVIMAFGFIVKARVS